MTAPSNLTEATTIHPGDHLIIRTATDVDPEHLAHTVDALRDRLPGIDITVINAEQLLIYRTAPATGTTDA